MSKTDKTDPFWVYIMRYGVEVHNHERGECDIEEWTPGTSFTNRWLRNRCWKTSDGIHYRNSYAGSDYSPRYTANRMERGARAKLRADCKKALYDPDHEIEPYRHRHGAAWYDW